MKYETNGPGKHGKALEAALKEAGGRQGILIVVDAPDGPGFTCALDAEIIIKIPSILRQVARQIEQRGKNDR